MSEEGWETAPFPAKTLRYNKIVETTPLTNPMTLTLNPPLTPQLTDTELRLPSPDILEKFVSELEERYSGPIPGINHTFDYWFDFGGTIGRSVHFLPRISLLKDIPVVPDAPARLRQVAAIVDKAPSCLNMGEWHTCETTHCIAGWATHLAGEGMVKRLKKLSHGHIGIAGTMLLGHEAACYFYDMEDDTAARAFLKRQLYPV